MPQVLLVTDGAINIGRRWKTRWTSARTRSLARTFGVEQPKVAILAAVETVD
jgi:hypothetical protein